jgi:hypothetical protein
MNARTALAVAVPAGVVAACLLAVASCRAKALPAHVVFADVPESSGFDFRHELPGGTLDNLPKSSMGGLALIDYDRDGKVDIYCVNGGWDDVLASSPRKPSTIAKSRLYRNLGGMRFQDVTDAAHVGFEGFGMGACVGDFDGDGFPDLFVTAYGAPALYRNRGDGTFEEVAAKAGIEPGFYAGATFLDYDRDGVVDLFVVQYVDPSELPLTADPPNSFPAPRAYKGQPARLYHGRGDGTFEDRTAAAGVGKPGHGMGVLATDVDDDGYVDLLVANDSEANFLWHNHKDGTFLEAGGLLLLALGSDGEGRASMGVTAADLDGDGRLDYLIPDTQGGCAYVHRGSYFTDRAIDWGLSAAAHRLTGWSDVAVDADNDGRTDVWKVQGDVRSLERQWSYLAMNHGTTDAGGLNFVYEPPDLGPPGPDGSNSPEQQVAAGICVAQIGVAGRGGVAADLDSDGREDLVLLALNDRARILRNITQDAGHWVHVRLQGKAGNTSALGALLTGKAGGRKVVREVASSTGYLCGPDLRISVGLGTADALDGVVVRWPSGKEESVGSLAAGMEHVVTEK